MGSLMDSIGRSAADNAALMQPAKPAPVAPPNAFEQALQQYPALQKLGLGYTATPSTSGNMLEFWQPGESGDPTQPRPQGIPLGQPGVEIYSDKVRPIDVLGDVVSHYLVNTDPKIQSYFQTFSQSMTPQQQQILQSQYAHAQANEGETRPFDEWASQTGLPAYFRGYAFQQWPQDFVAKAYTPEQRYMFDEMMQYLGAPQ
jgi:hypothetical protein